MSGKKWSGVNSKIKKLATLVMDFLRPLLFFYWSNKEIILAENYGRFRSPVALRGCRF